MPEEKNVFVGQLCFVDEAIKQIITAHGRKPNYDVHMVMSCPLCGGKLRYAQSSYNGHTQGMCEEDGCLNWRE